MSAYARSALLRHVEEALAEGYAQLRINGLAAAVRAYRFPLDGGYVTVAQLATEGCAIGSIVLGGIVFRGSFHLSRSQPTMIERDAAVLIARTRATENGWPFGEPIQITLRRGWFGQDDRYEIETNAGQRGTKARFTVNAVTGAILSEGYIPR
jgi:hypothetical protein